MARRTRPRTRHGRAAGLALAAAAGAGGVAALLRWRLWSGNVPSPAAAELTDWFDPADLVRNREYRRGVWAMAAASVPVAPVVAVAVAATGRRWRPWLVARAGGRTVRAGALFGGGLAATLAVAALPLAAARFAWGRHHGVVTQGAAGWLADVGKGTAIQVVLMGGAGAAVAVLIRRFPRGWWAGTAAGAAALTYALVALSPLVVEPLFQKTRPLGDPVLEADVLDVARRSGVQAQDVKVNDASTRTTAANAYVSGLGGSRHVVLYDTLLRDFPRDQVRMVVAHEMAHVERRHVLKGSTWAAAMAFPAALLVFAAVGWRTGFAKPGPGEAGTDLVVRRLAVAAAAAVALGAATAPLGNVVSRAYEREAEWRALQVTGDADAAVGLQQGLVARSLGVPDPPAWVRLWFGTHPTALERIAMARRAEGT